MAHLLRFGLGGMVMQWYLGIKKGGIRLRFRAVASVARSNDLAKKIGRAHV